MSVSVRNTTRRRPVRARRIAQRTDRLLAAAGFDGAELAVSLVGDHAIRSLNRVYRGKDRATDVLSFPLFEREEIPQLRRRKARPLLGDVVVSIDTAQRQAQAYDASLEQELERLLIHGVLHVLGHDHEFPEEARLMRREERRLARVIGLAWPYQVGEERSRRRTPGRD